MPTFDNQVTYWDKEGSTKTFTHPVDFTLLDGVLDRRARILDYGCGYGRVANLLYKHGFRAVEGVDSSAPMIARGRHLYPHLRLTLIDPSSLPWADATFDAVVLFAVLTCIPSNDAQCFLVGEVFRLLRCGGILYISDLCLQSDARNLARYHAFHAKYGVYGIFELPEGVVFRHHDMRWIISLVSRFDLVTVKYLDVMTMNNHPARAFQLLACKSAR